MIEKEHIHVRVPCGFFVSAAVTAFLGLLERLNSEPKCPYRFTTGLLGNYKPADYARNVIVEAFLEDASASRLWFIDSDMIPAPNSPQLLWHKKYDIVAAPYPFWGRRNAEWEPDASWGIYDFSDDRRSFKQKSPLDEGLVHNDAAGTGMMIISRRVLEDPRMIVENRSYQKMDRSVVSLKPSDARPFFQNGYKANGAFEWTEDLEFCYRARNLDYSVVVDHGVKCGHIKQVDVLHVMDFAVRSYQKGWNDYEKMAEQAGHSIVRPLAGQMVA